MEKTAIQEYTKDIFNLITDAMDNDLSLQWLKDKIELEISLEYVEKEKQQIIDAVTYGQNNYTFTTNDDKRIAENYYYNTFKQD